MAKAIRVLDTTLRDGEQTPGVSLTPAQKLSIAKALDEMGVDIIEAGSAITSAGECESIRLVASEGLNAEVASFARVVQKDIDLAMQCGVDSIFLVMPSSDMHIKYKLGTTRQELLDKTLSMIDYCKKHGLKVDLCAEDGSRADVGFLKTVLSKAVEHKIDCFTLADTVGFLTPDKTDEIFRRLVKGVKVPVGVHCHDDLGLATANTVTAVNSGAIVVDVAVNGLGERAGNASLEEVVMALKLGYGYRLNIKTEKLSWVSELVERSCGIPVPPNKAIVGDNAFTHGAGIHIDGILKKSETYEAIRPELVGAKRRFVLGKHVGMKAVKSMLDEMKINVNDTQLEEIFKQIKFIGDKGKHVTSVDLEAIANSVLGIQKQAKIKLLELVAVAGNKFTPTASVKLMINGAEVICSGVGTGPVDAAITAIRNGVRGVPFELTEYHVDAISGGTDALVRIEVRLKSKDRIVTSQGTGTDIILASVDAMINGLNLIMAYSD